MKYIVMYVLILLPANVCIRKCASRFLLIEIKMHILFVTKTRFIADEFIVSR